MSLLRLNDLRGRNVFGAAEYFHSEPFQKTNKIKQDLTMFHTTNKELHLIMTFVQLNNTN